MLRQIQFQVTDPHDYFENLEHKMTGLTKTYESGGGGGDIHGFTFSHDAELVQWFKDRNEKNAIFADAMSMLQSIGATHTLTQYYLFDQEGANKILLGSDIEASIRDSFITDLPSIIVVNNKDTTGGAY